jgi:SAM-dependent methyltransferase
MLRDRGPLPPTPKTFGGQSVEEALPSGHLLACTNCGLQFRNPYPTDEQLLALYEGLSDAVWALDEPHPVWPLILDMMEEAAPPRAVLDIGCFRGDFLAWLPAEWHRFGVEPNRKAAEFATGRGVEMLGPTIETAAASAIRPSVVTAFDVIEHLRDPLCLLNFMKDRLAPGGRIILLTGATESWPFRLLGADYWYCTLPEHVTFYSLRWFEWAAQQLSLRIVRHAYVRSETFKVRAWARQGAIVAIHAWVRALRNRGVPDRVIKRLPYGRLALHWQTTPWWKQARDQLLVALARRDGTPSTMKIST